MNSLLDEFEYRRSVVTNLNYEEARARLSGFYKWLDSQPTTKEMVDRLISETGAQALLSTATDNQPPEATTPEQIAGVGCLLLRLISEGQDPYDLSYTYGITPAVQSRAIQDFVNEVVQRYIEPALDYIQRELNALEQSDAEAGARSAPSPPRYPLQVHESLGRFLKEYPDPRRSAFLMMQFGSTSAHAQIVAAIKHALKQYGIIAHRADDRDFHEDLFANVLTYLHGCAFGIAVFERLEEDEFNPNVSLELGYMIALAKPVCLLKDRTLKALPADLVGKLYKSFDPQDPAETIPGVLDKWLHDKEIVTI